MKVPPGPPHRHRPHRHLFHLRTPLVRRRHRPVHQPHPVAHQRVRVVRPGGETPLPWDTGAGTQPNSIDHNLLLEEVLNRCQTWICSISSGANSFCPSPPKNSFCSPPVLPSTSRSMKKSRSCSTPEIRCYNCVNNGYGSKKFMIYLISTRHLYLATLPLPCSSLCCFILTFSKKNSKL